MFLNHSHLKFHRPQLIELPNQLKNIYTPSIPIHQSVENK